MNNDLISRSVAIGAIDNLPNCYNGWSDTYDKACIIGVIEELPPAEPERNTGRWIDTRSGCICSKCCWKLQTTGMPKFCPNCGADMRGGADE